MADIASRTHPTNPQEFLHLFTSSFPPPKDNYWTLCQLPENITSKVFSTMLTPTFSMAQWSQLTMTGTATGKLGAPSSTPTSLKYDPTFKTSHTKKPLNCWLPSPDMFGPDAATQPASKSEHKQSAWHYQPSGRSPYWTDNQRRWAEQKAKHGLTRSQDRLSRIAERIHQQAQN